MKPILIITFTFMSFIVQGQNFVYKYKLNSEILEPPNLVDNMLFMKNFGSKALNYYTVKKGDTSYLYVTDKNNPKFENLRFYYFKIKNSYFENKDTAYIKLNTETKSNVFNDEYGLLLKTDLPIEKANIRNRLLLLLDAPTYLNTSIYSFKLESNLPLTEKISHNSKRIIDEPIITKSYFALDKKGDDLYVNSLTQNKKIYICIPFVELLFYLEEDEDKYIKTIIDQINDIKLLKYEIFIVTDEELKTNQISILQKAFKKTNIIGNAGFIISLMQTSMIKKILVTNKNNKVICNKNYADLQLNGDDIITELKNIEANNTQ